jgi:SAM-dependent methyltransferase
MTSSPLPNDSPALLARSSSLKASTITLEQLRAKIESELSTMPHLEGLRNFNLSNLQALTQHVAGDRAKARILDVGASIHGFALQGADELGFREYIGIDLDVRRQWGTLLLQVTNGSRCHLLCQMDAHRLWIEDESMDAALCLSGFEHYLFPELVIAEMRRVLKPGGVALINYEPIWTCSYGHHLHHFGIGYDQVPPWSHLFLTKAQMRELLAGKSWPEQCPISKAQALEWIYDGREINRRDCRFHRALLGQIEGAGIVWLVPHLDPSSLAQAAVDYASSLVPYSREELLTRGYSCCFRK